MPFFNGKLSTVIENSKFSCKMSIFWPMGHKDGNFLFLSMPEPIVTFLGLKITHLLKVIFFKTPCTCFAWVNYCWEFCCLPRQPRTTSAVQPWRERSQKRCLLVKLRNTTEMKNTHLQPTRELLIFVHVDDHWPTSVCWFLLRVDHGIFQRF